MLKKILLLLALLLVILAVVTWLDAAGRAPVVPPAASATQLAALSDAELERRVISDLAHRVLGPAGKPAAWKSFALPARHVWALDIVEQWINAYGLSRFREAAPEQPDAPGLAQAYDACVAMDLPEVAQAFADAASATTADTNAIQLRLTALLAQPAMHAKRIAYLRRHLDALAVPQ